MVYTTVEEVMDFQDWSTEFPEFIDGTSPTNNDFEEVDVSGTITTGSIVYLDHPRLIENTLLLAYGVDKDNTTDLVEDTDFTVEEDRSKITINATGAGKITTNNLYAKEYNYIRIQDRPGVRNSTVSRLVTVADTWIDEEINQTFQGVFTTSELLKGRGRDYRIYRTEKKTINVVETELGDTLDSSSTTVTVVSTTGLQAGMYLSVEKEAMLIGSVDDTTTLTVTRGVLSSTAVSHSSGETVINTVVEVSITPLGGVPTYSTLKYSADYSINELTSTITLLHNDITREGLQVGHYPTNHVPDRLRVSHSYGSSTIPTPINQAAILVVTRLLTSSAISKGLAEGSDGFTPRANDVLTDDIKMMLRDYKIMLIGGF